MNGRKFPAVLVVCIIKIPPQERPILAFAARKVQILHRYERDHFRLGGQDMGESDRICVSVFKGGKIDRERYTAVWKTLIERLVEDQYVLAREEL